MPDEMNIDDFRQCSRDYQGQWFRHRKRLDGHGLQGAAFPACAPALICRILNPLGRLDAWIELADFCANSGDRGRQSACALEAEALLPAIAKQNLRDTRILWLIKNHWLPSGEIRKVRDHCLTMADTERRRGALLLVGDRNPESDDAAPLADIPAEAATSALACLRTENGAEGCLGIWEWARSKSNPPGERCAFERAGQCLVPPVPGEPPAPSEEELLSRLERIYPDPRSIVDTIPPPPPGPYRP